MEVDSEEREKGDAYLFCWTNNIGHWSLMKV